MPGFVLQRKVIMAHELFQANLIANPYVNEITARLEN